MTLTDAIYGPLRGTADVEFAALNTLETWLPTMLRVLERRHGFPPGTLTEPSCRDRYYGGIDFDSWVQENLPVLIAVVQPTGQADQTVGGWSQWFTVEVAAIVQCEDEDEARVLAGHIGTAAIASLAQHGDLGGVASVTLPVSAAPVLEFPDPESRTIVRARGTLQTYVEGLVNSLAAPKTPTPPDSPQYPGDPDLPYEDWPAHTSTHVTVAELS